jgi:hypothetical protein
MGDFHLGEVIDKHDAVFKVAQLSQPQPPPHTHRERFR